MPMGLYVHIGQSYIGMNVCVLFCHRSVFIFYYVFHLYLEVLLLISIWLIENDNKWVIFDTESAYGWS